MNFSEVSDRNKKYFQRLDVIFIIGLIIFVIMLYIIIDLLSIFNITDPQVGAFGALISIIPTLYLWAKKQPN